MNPQDAVEAVGLKINCREYDNKRETVDALNENINSFSNKEDCYFIIQSFVSISFNIMNKEHKNALLAQPLIENSFSGRIFNEEKEIRWILDDNVFRIYELTEDVKSEKNFIKQEFCYYLYGIGKDGIFQESIVRSAKLDYPVIPSQPVQNDDRPYITVALYLPCKPVKWSDDIEDIVRKLNSPTVSQHRFVTYGYGKDIE